MNKIVLGLLFLTASGFAGSSGVVSPYYQSVQDMTTILSSKELANTLQTGYPILSITNTRDNAYRVSAVMQNGQICTVHVGVRKDNGKPANGVKQLELEIGKKECK